MRFYGLSIKSISNKELTAHTIAEKMNIGIRSFYRKLEEIEGVTLTDLICDCRLAKRRIYY